MSSTKEIGHSVFTIKWGEGIIKRICEERDSYIIIPARRDAFACEGNTLLLREVEVPRKECYDTLTELITVAVAKTMTVFPVIPKKRSFSRLGSKSRLLLPTGEYANLKN